MARALLEAIQILTLLAVLTISVRGCVQVDAWAEASHAAGYHH